MNSGIPEQIKQDVYAALCEFAHFQGLGGNVMNDGVSLGNLHDRILTALAPHFTQQESLGEWKSCEEGLPDKGRRVMVAHLNGIHVWRAIATYWPAGTMDATMWDDPPDDWWDESGNKCVCPDAGWWEECFAVDGASMLSNVTHWMPLPESPGLSAARLNTEIKTK